MRQLIIRTERLVALGGLLAAAWLTALGSPCLAGSADAAGAVLLAQAQPPAQNVETSIAQLHQRLQITPAQQPRFAAFANVMRDNARMTPGSPPANANAVDALRMAIQYGQQDLAGMRRLLPVLQALYASLSPAQQKTADMVFRQGPGRVTPRTGENRPHNGENRRCRRPDCPLNDFFVIDLTAHRAGPTAARQLADWGADVLKIEPPGEQVDATGSRRDGPDFQNLHRNKRAMTLNLKSKEGLEIFFKLAARADVVVENYRSDVKHRLGVDYEAVKKINPRIVYGSISGFGQDGPYAGRPGVDQIAQGMGGLMSITGHPGQGPVRVGIAINDTSAGLLLSYGIVLALLNRERTGEGQWVHTSLLEAQIYMLDFQAARYLMKGEVAGQEGNFHPTSPGTGMFQTADGYINIAASGDNLWRRFCEAAGARDLLDNPDFKTVVARARNRPALNAHLNEIIRRHPNAYWVELLNKVGVPCGPINTIDQTFADPQVQYLGIAKPVAHPKLGPQKVVGQPIHLSGYPQPDELRPTPDQGEHTDAVLRDLGYDVAAIAGLRERGAI